MNENCDMTLKWLMIRGHTLITLAHRGTYLVCKMLTAILEELPGTVVKMLTRVVGQKLTKMC